MDSTKLTLLPCSSAQLNLDVVLNNGQSFRWKKEAGQDSWVGVTRHRFWRIWRPSDKEIAFEVLHNFENPNSITLIRRDDDEQIELLRDYFQLDVQLEELYRFWTSKDSHFTNILTENPTLFQGIRILNQDPVETLFAFICSANNNISRISKMVDKLCELYGTRAMINTDLAVYDFPTIAQMSTHLQTMEQTLRDSGFGYRAASIVKTVQKLVLMNMDAETWLNSLKMCPYSEAKAQLMELPGIGPKVADCICLMALGKHEVVPVDRHVFNLTAQIYKPKFLSLKNGTKSSSSVSKTAHAQIGQFYADLFGPYAGWAQSILFTTRLRRFATKL